MTRCLSIYLALVSILGLGACGGEETEVLLALQPGACFSGGQEVGSVAIAVAIQEQVSVEAPLVPISWECYTPRQRYPTTLEGINALFRERGYIADDVETGRATWIGVRLYADQEGCRAALDPCLISDLVPPEADRKVFNLNTTCEEAVVSPIRRRCLDATMP